MRFLKYKPILEELNYPNIYTLNAEIQEVFSSHNRYRLLSWIAKIMNPHFNVPAEWSVSSQAEFADFFQEGGFCSLSDKLSFVRGDEKLSKKIELKIFDRIFTLLQVVHQKENIKLKENTFFSPSDLLKFVTTDNNLFPEYGPIKRRSHAEREELAEYYKQQIEKLQKETAEFSEKDFDFSISDYPSKKNNENLVKFEEQLINLKDIFMTVSTPQDQPVDRVEFKPEIGTILESCNNETDSILQFFKNASITEELEKHVLKENFSLEGDDSSHAIELLVQLSSDVIETLKLDSLQKID